MNGILFKLWPDYIPDSRKHDISLVSVTENVVKIAKETGLYDVEVGNVNENLNSHGEELSLEF
jgi:hypothetical protein